MATEITWTHGNLGYMCTGCPLNHGSPGYRVTGFLFYHGNLGYMDTDLFYHDNPGFENKIKMATNHGPTRVTAWWFIVQM